MSNEEYQDEIGEFDEEGNMLFRNTSSNGRFHSDWCSMMYSRLKLAHNLLSNDGVIFISIDDNEVDNLRKICDEVYGEVNFIANLVWKSKSGGSNDTGGIAIDTEYILVYAKSKTNLKLNLDKNAEVSSSYNLVDENGKRYGLDRLDKQSLGYHDSLDFPIIGPDGKEYVVEHKNPNVKKARWRWSKETVKEKYNELVFKYPYVYTKNYEKDGYVYRNLLVDEKYGRTRTGKTTFADLFDGISIFSFPKPYVLIEHIVNMICDNDSMVLDFFSGSATTAHAVMKLNAEDGGNRKFIMIQLPEETDEDSEAYKAGYENICEIGKERIRRAGTKIKEETGKDIDYGFRVLKLSDSNMKDVFYNPEEYTQKMLLDNTSNIKNDRTEDDLLFSSLIERGVPLNKSYRKEKIDGHNVIIYNEEGEAPEFVACFDKKISEKCITEIAKMKPLKAVFRDSSFENSASRINLEELFKMYSKETKIKVM